MSTNFIRSLFVSTLVLGSFGTLTDAALADDKVVTIPFSCTVPSFGKERCGDANSNLHVGPLKRLSVQIDSMPQDDQEPVCLTFFVYHAVSGEELKEYPKVCDTNSVKRLWTNPENAMIDVYVMVKSNKTDEMKIEGRYFIDRP